MTESNKHVPVVAIVGTGAIGSVLAGILFDSGVQVGMIGRNGTEAYDCLIHQDGGSRQLQLAAIEKYNLVFICVKAYQVLEVLQQNLPIWQKLSVHAIICLSNGLIDYDLKRITPVPELHLGLTTMAVSQQEGQKRSYNFWNPDSAQVVWGGPSTPGFYEKKLFEKVSSKHFSWRQDIDQLRRRKWLFNTALNSICGKYLLPENQGVQAHAQELQQVFQEGYLLGERLWGPWPDSEKSMLELFWSLVRQTGANRNSMVADLMAGRRTEVDYLSGLYRQDPDQSYPLLAELTGRIKLR